jgi:hypothetical protein
VANLGGEEEERSLHAGHWEEGLPLGERICFSPTNANFVSTQSTLSMEASILLPEACFNGGYEIEHQTLPRRESCRGSGILPGGSKFFAMESMEPMGASLFLGKACFNGGDGRFVNTNNEQDERDNPKQE